MTPGKIRQIRKAELLQEISRLQADLADAQKSGQQAAEAYQSAGEELFKVQKELEQARSPQVHCMACGGVECHRLAEIVKLTGVDSDQHIVEWVEAAKNLNEWYKKRIDWLTKQWSEAKERERQLQKTFAVTTKIKEALRKKLGDIWRKYNQLNNQAHWLTGRVKMLEDREQMVHDLGAGYAAPKLENRELRTKMKELESANALAQQENRQLREALTRYATAQWGCSFCAAGPDEDGHYEEHEEYHDIFPDVDGRAVAEAALTVPPTPLKVKTMNDYLTDPLALAVLFHHTYERLAPGSGYETRKETRIFDPESPNGKLMIRVCGEIQSALKENYPDMEEDSSPSKIPPARSVATGRLVQSGTTANTDMTKATNRPPVKGRGQKGWSCFDEKGEVKSKDDFIRALAVFLVNDQERKSIELEMKKSHAVEWAALRKTTPLFGYPSVEEAEIQLREWLSFPPAGRE